MKASYIRLIAAITEQAITDLGKNKMLLFNSQDSSERKKLERENQLIIDFLTHSPFSLFFVRGDNSEDLVKTINKRMDRNIKILGRWSSVPRAGRQIN